MHLVQKPDTIYDCIRSIPDRVGYYMEIQIIFGSVYTFVPFLAIPGALLSAPAPTSPGDKISKLKIKFEYKKCFVAALVKT